jgi:UDP-N-acetylglucosamine 2-epimerase (non-hydrolysing)/GDP/UDP-N,N'-diacetylbacillosamine 2-epimerase (hydrolysing)
LDEDRPDMVVLLGDRFEIVPIALACVLHSVPVAHVHGGELSAGALDEYFRHATTKLASLHFPATAEYRRRLLQLGEEPDRVIAVGAPGLDHLHRTELLSREALETILGVSLDVPTAIVTYHPVTTEPGTSAAAVRSLVEGLLAEDRLQAVFTKANADHEGGAINALLEEFTRENPARFKLFDNLGVKVYFSCLKHFDLMIGNSSSGLIEAPAFRLPVVNVGPRQDGRTRARNVIDVGTTTTAIRDGIRMALLNSFRSGLVGMINPYDQYGDGKVAGRMTAAIKAFLSTHRSTRKSFFDLDLEALHA